MFIQRSGFECRENIALDKFLLQVLNVDFFRSGFVRLIGDADKLFLLPQISGDSDDIRVIFFLQPFNDNGRVEAA